MKRKNIITVQVDTAMEDTLVAISVIEKLLKKNKLTMDLIIGYDFKMEDRGCFYPQVRKNIIFINPTKCCSKKEINKQEMINLKLMDEEELIFKEPFYPGSPSDLTLFGTTLHEFMHLLQFKVYKNIISEYTKRFPTERFYLNDYCNNEICDELAEIMTLYVTNPYLLKLISKKHYDFCKEFFKSPTSCNVQKCHCIYEGFPISVKEHLKHRWKLAYDENLKKFVRIDDGKNKKEDSKKLR